ncbi:DUF6230 family protein [Streptomyces sp. NPDC048664]|uniref:DUF6230 family protein n=1 Tax=Streptomyces sp. NPDC048664 TaxID=3154505 RepID=UPI0034284B85
MESQVRGGTRWKRFAVVMVPSVAATAAIGVALAQGALAASFSVSGQEFKVTADSLTGQGFSQYGAVDSGYDLGGKQMAHPVAVSAFKSAQITKMCQSVVTKVPFIGDVTLRLDAGPDSKHQVEAENLYIDVDTLDANATFHDMNIGVAGKDLQYQKMSPGDLQGSTPKANPYGFAQEASSAELTNVKQKAWATTAGTFKLSGLHMALNMGNNECY